jgi:hypothetical protein
LACTRCKLGESAASDLLAPDCDTLLSPGSQPCLSSKDRALLNTVSALWRHLFLTVEIEKAVNIFYKRQKINLNCFEEAIRNTT